MEPMRNRLRRLFGNEKGATVVEYAVILALIIAGWRTSTRPLRTRAPRVHPGTVIRTIATAMTRIRRIRRIRRISKNEPQRGADC